jgi:hypothetical protein
MAKYDAMLDGIPMPERFAPLVAAKAEPAAAPTPSVALAPGEDAPGESDDDAAVAPTAAATPAGAQPAPTAAAPAGAPAAPQKAGGSAVYLSDKELLEAQSATDDGEVVE